MDTNKWSQYFDVLSNVHRRRLLVALLDHNPQRFEIRPAEGVNEADMAQSTLRVEMHHLHLPKLEGAGFIRWERESGEIYKGPRFEEIRPLLELFEKNSDGLPEGWV